MKEERDLQSGLENIVENNAAVEISGEATLESLGAILVQEREKQELSLSYLAGETKIRQAYLEGIETGRLEGFHGNVYRRGFVRSYLSILGREDLWKYYDGLLQADSDIVPDSTPPLGDFTPPAKGFRKGSRKGVVALLLLVITVSGWYVWNNRDSIREEVAKIQQEQHEHAQEAEKKAQQAIVEDASRKEAEAAAASQDLTPVVESEHPVLVIKAKKDSWIRVTREKERLFGGTLKAGSQKSIEASGRIYAIYGSPENLAVSWDGKKTEIVPANGTGPVHFLYAPDGAFKGLTSQEAEKIWGDKKTEAASEKEQPQEEVKKGPSFIIFKAVKGDCWMRVLQGEKKLFAGTLKRGTEKKLELTGTINAKFGNPSAVTVFIDDKEVGQPGKAGQIGRMVYNEDGTFHQVKKK